MEGETVLHFTVRSWRPDGEQYDTVDSGLVVGGWWFGWRRVEVRSPSVIILRSKELRIIFFSCSSLLLACPRLHILFARAAAEMDLDLDAASLANVCLELPCNSTVCCQLSCRRFPVSPITPHLA